jgi:hypothetical protein
MQSGKPLELGFTKVLPQYGLERKKTLKVKYNIKTLIYSFLWTTYVPLTALILRIL